MKRSRGRGRRQQNPVNRSYDSNGPDVRVRGAASQVYEKYQALARDAMSSGDRVMAENYGQHAEHYYRIMLSLQPAPSEADKEAANGEMANGEAAGSETPQAEATESGDEPLVLVRDGDEVKVNTPLFIIEAMKMESTITSPVAGTVRKVHLKEKNLVEQDDLVIELS